MDKTISFTAAVWEKYGGDIEHAVLDYIDENLTPDPDGYFPINIILNRIISYDAPGNKIEFDAVVIGCADCAEEWFRVSCEVELDGGLYDFTINGIEIYNYRHNRKRGLLSDTLVPIIYADELEKHAEAILREYYPEALKKPQKIDVYLLAERMGLSIEEIRLTRNRAVFGGMLFDNGMVDYYDDEYCCYDNFYATAGTVLVDPEIYFLRTLGCFNNTVMHEGIHWVKHRKVFELEKLFNGNADRILCRVTEAATDERKRTDTEWMEWHANTIAPRVLMPRRMFRQKAEEYITLYKQKKRTDSLSAVMRSVINDLAEFFGVSVQAAKIRMIDIGYTEAIGVYEYVDARYVPAYSFGNGAIKKNQTFSVPVADALHQYEYNAHFRRMIDTGCFIYIDAHYCINDPKYITQNKYGVLEMTEYAVLHMDECCLVFSRATRPNAEYGVMQYTKYALFQNAVSKNITEYKYRHDGTNKELEERAAAIRRELSGIKDAAGILDTLPGTFNKSLVFLMRWRKITVEQLAEKALLNPKTIQRMRTDQNYQCELETVIALCVGLQLPPYISTPFIERAGLKIKMGERDLTYAHLLATHYKCPIFEFNEYLEAVGYPPLSGKE